MASLKQCVRCGLKLLSDEFRKTRGGSRENTCRKCQNKRVQARYRLKHPVVLRTPYYGEMPAGTKWCPKCKQMLQFESFGKNKTQKFGLTAYCRECQKKVSRRHLYGLTDTAYKQLLFEQNGFCKICGRKFGMAPHVDHDHSTGRIRGLLCNKCNTAIGMFNEDIACLKAAIVYLESGGN